MYAQCSHKNIRLPAKEYIGKKAYFITLCSAARRKILASPEISNDLLDMLRSESVVRCVAIPAYCLMPDHLHFLAHGLKETSDLLAFVKSFRIKSSRAYARKAGKELWQKKFFDCILRSTISLESVAWYIWMNPMRAGLSQSIGEYPFAGSFTDAEPFGKQPEKIWEPKWVRSSRE